MSEILMTFNTPFPIVWGCLFGTASHVHALVLCLHLYHFMQREEISLCFAFSPDQPLGSQSQSLQLMVWLNDGGQP